jgi:hypothetical protein
MSAAGFTCTFICIPSTPISSWARRCWSARKGARAAGLTFYYEIRGPQPSGKPGIVEGYAFLWEAYQKQYAPDVVAVARPHAYAWVGETVTVDGSRFWRDQPLRVDFFRCSGGNRFQEPMRKVK